MSTRECIDSSTIQLTTSNSNSSSDDEYVELELHSPIVTLSSNNEVIVEETRSPIQSVDGRLLILRILNIIMSMISFSVMSSVPFINEADLNPVRMYRYYSYSCDWIRGSFNYRAYQAVLSVGVIVCFANIVLTLLVLPYPAVLSKTFQSMMKPLHTAWNDSDLALICLQMKRELPNNCTTMDRKSWIPLECCMDAVLFTMSLITFISSIAVLGSAELFHYKEQNDVPLYERYFTLSTFLTTNLKNGCDFYRIYNKNSIVTLIVVSLWFLFFSMICTGSSLMRVLGKHRHHHHHHKSVQPTVTTHNGDDNKIPTTMGPVSYSDHTRKISNMTTAAYNDDDGDDDYDAGEEVEEKKDNEVNAPPAASHAVVDHHPRSIDGSTASRDETAQAVDSTEIGIKGEMSANITQQTINPLFVINTSVNDTAVNNGGGSSIESNDTATNQYVTLLQLRKANMAFSLVTAVLMIFVPYITEAIFKPNDHLKRDCTVLRDINYDQGNYGYRTARFQYMNGSFNYRPYQLLLSVGVIVFTANCFMLKKNLVFAILIDLVLLLLSISAFIATIVILNAPTKFDLIYKIHYYNNHYPDYDTHSYTYYDTLHTFFLNFSDCLQTNDPTILIHASVVTLFLSMLITYTSARITFQDYIDKLRVELKNKVGNEDEFQGMLAQDPTAAV